MQQTHQNENLLKNPQILHYTQVYHFVYTSACMHVCVWSENYFGSVYVQTNVCEWWNVLLNGFVFVFGLHHWVQTTWYLNRNDNYNKAYEQTTTATMTRLAHSTIPTVVLVAVTATHYLQWSSWQQPKRILTVSPWMAVVWRFSPILTHRYSIITNTMTTSNDHTTHTHNIIYCRLLITWMASYFMWFNFCRLNEITGRLSFSISPLSSEFVAFPTFGASTFGFACMYVCRRSSFSLAVIKCLLASCLVCQKVVVFFMLRC